MSTEYLTKEGFKKLQDELDTLRNVRRKEIAERLREAAENSLGEFVEDPEFEAAKNEQSFVEGRIKELEILLANATLIESKGRKKGGAVEIGSKVTIQQGRRKPEEYMIVGAAEANPREGKISHESPLGSALLGKKEGDKADINAPSGSFSVKITKVV
ncbi:MAG: transcription elongation factor GreA [Anaerolineales bacterium]|nr:transcription elongation factor GreA [Anaerolineales bacterium]MCL4258486.1 transcription elongation factor GreA [Anaerolineales bacterium]QYK50159.1 MAG: transcription elongation factor GreA [Anaerolineales bacterium]